MTGIHHLYVETRDWNASLVLWEALGFHLEDGWGGGEQRDGILSVTGTEGPYLFLRQVGGDHERLAFDVVFGARDLDQISASEGVVVDRPRFSSGWGPDLLTVRDPDGRVLTIRGDDVAGPSGR